MRTLDLVAGAVIASVVVFCAGAVVFSAREAGRSAGRRIKRRSSAGPKAPPAPRRPGDVDHRRIAGHPPPDVARRRERAAARPRRRD